MAHTGAVSEVIYFRSGDTAWKVVDGCVIELDTRTCSEEDLDAIHPLFRDDEGYALDEGGRRLTDEIYDDPWSNPPVIGGVKRPDLIVEHVEMRDGEFFIWTTSTSEA